MLRQQGKSTGEQYVAEVLRVSGDGVQTPVYDDARLHVGPAVFAAMPGEQVERDKDENAGQQQHQHSCAAQNWIAAPWKELSDDDEGNRNH